MGPTLGQPVSATCHGRLVWHAFCYSVRTVDGVDLQHLSDESRRLARRDVLLVSCDHYRRDVEVRRSYHERSGTQEACETTKRCCGEVAISPFFPFSPFLV